MQEERGKKQRGGGVDTRQVMAKSDGLDCCIDVVHLSVRIFFVIFIVKRYTNVYLPQRKGITNDTNAKRPEKQQRSAKEADQRAGPQKAAAEQRGIAATATKTFARVDRSEARSTARYRINPCVLQTRLASQKTHDLKDTRCGPAVKRPSGESAACKPQRNLSVARQEHDRNVSLQ